MEIPKKWMESKCALCRHFWAYPIFNGEYEDWTWECESDDLDDDPDGLVGINEPCEGFEPNFRINA